MTIISHLLQSRSSIRLGHNVCTKVPDEKLGQITGLFRLVQFLGRRDGQHPVPEYRVERGVRLKLHCVPGSLNIVDLVDPCFLLLLEAFDS